MQLSETNTYEFVEGVIPPDGRIHQSTIYRGDVAIADINVNAEGLWIGSFLFRFGEVSDARMEGLRKWLAL